MTPISSIIGSNIRRYRELAGITQDELAWRVGSHRPIVSRAERGTHELELKAIYAYADALDIPVGLLIEGIDQVVSNRPLLAGKLTTG